MTEYIHVVNWEKHQHGKKRSLPWIKLHGSLLHDDDWNDLSAKSQAILVHIWLITNERGNDSIRVDTRSLKRNFRCTKKQLEPLIHAGFIEVQSSNRLASVYPDASPDVEVEGDVDPPNPRRAGGPRATGQNPRARQRRTKHQRAVEAEARVALASYEEDLEHGEPYALRNLREYYPSVADRVLELANQGAA